MIQVLQRGSYSLIRTTHLQKFLSLDKRTYDWVQGPVYGEFLATSRKRHKTDWTLSVGSYVLYEVHDEEGYSNAFHLELEAGVDCWQGYLLLSNPFNSSNKKSRIFPTHETITGRRCIGKRMNHHLKEVSYGR